MSVHNSPLDGVLGVSGLVAESTGLATAFAAAGFRLYLVGGIVRDLFIEGISGEPDFDFTTDASPAAVKKLIDPIVDVLWTQGERFGTIAAKQGERVLEITTHRAEAYDPASRKPDVVFSTEVLEDLSRRDFTINAMAIEITNEEPRLIDPFGGLNDIQDRVLRTPQAATVSFSDDPLRMLRAARFIARLRLTAEPELLAAVKEMCERIEVVSVERVRDEFDKLLLAENPLGGFNFLRSTGLITYITAGLGADYPPAQQVEGLGMVQADLPVRLATILSASGRPDARRWLRKRRYSRDVITQTLAILDSVHRLAKVDADLDAAIRRLVRGAQGSLESSIEVARAVDPDAGAHLEAVRARVNELGATEDLSDLSPGLDGTAVMNRLGLPAGREVGDALAFLLDIRLDEGPLGTEKLHERLDTWWASKNAGEN